MAALKFEQGVKSASSKRTAEAGILPTCPGQVCIGVVTAVDKDGARMELLDELLATGIIARPNAGGQAVITFVDEADRFVVAGHLGDWSHSAERLVPHDRHFVSYVGPQYRRRGGCNRVVRL